MSTSDSLIGQTIGNYEILREIGRGGMGVVYKAHEQSLQRVVALKVLPKRLAKHEAFVKRFVREARAAARLSHPNIVHVYAVGQHQGTYFIAMEYIKGRSLADLIREEGPLEVLRALDITRQVAEALAEAHKHDIIHRDIKPQNIMLDAAGRVKVMDFGLAKAVQASTQLTADGAVLGTPTHMSPEQCEGKAVDARTDIYSLGVTLFEMLVGRPPFEADTPLALMYKIMHEPMPPVEELNNEVSPIVAQVIDDMTAREPEKRYPSTEVLCMHLSAMLRGEAPPPLEKVRAPRPQPKREGAALRSQPADGRRFWKWLLLISALAAVLLVGSILVSLLVGSQNPDDAGWESLFNGEDLTGWQRIEGEPLHAGIEDWLITDNAIMTPGNRSLLRTEGKWTDFELDLEFRASARANGGVYLRGRIELQIHEPRDSLPTNKSMGAVYDQHAALTYAARPPGEWNRLEVRLEGNTLTAWLNGDLIHDHVEIAPTGVNPIGGAVTDPGPLVLQSWQGTVWYRNIRIRPLAKLSEQDEGDEWIVLFNGEDFTGWENARDPAKRITWSVLDGTLVTAGECTHVRTLDEWKDFEFEMEYKTTPGSNGGVDLRGRSQIQITGPEGDPKSRWGAGAIFGEHDPLASAAKPNGQWNHLRAKLIGDRLTVYLNDQLIHDNVQIAPQDYETFLPGPITNPGPIVLEGFLHTVAYRNIRIRPIPLSEGVEGVSWTPVDSFGPDETRTFAGIEMT